MTELKVGPKGLALIKHFESCKLKAYNDSVGVATIGWGSTYYLDGRKVKLGQTITQSEADAAFAYILDRDFASVVRSAMGESLTTPAQFGAMSALAYNIGAAAFKRSSVLRLHKAGASNDDVRKAFLMWSKAGGRVLPGLVRRRNAEAALYASDWAALKQYTNGQVS